MIKFSKTWQGKFQRFAPHIFRVGFFQQTANPTCAKGFDLWPIAMVDCDLDEMHLVWSPSLKRLNGWRIWAEDPGENLIESELWSEIGRTLELSERELQVCQHLFSGKTRNQIAAHLEIKLRTVRQYMEQVHTKLRVSNRVSLVLRIIQVRDYLQQKGRQ